MTRARPRRILPVIVVSQFAGSSLWFAGNAILGDLQRAWGLGPEALGYSTSAVQFGFITGTLIFAVLTVADRFAPRVVFLSCAVLGAVANASICVAPEGLGALLALRFATGFFLAGIYPVGMKIAASWYEKGLGEALGYLVGALVLGTAFPHLIRSIGVSLPWASVLLAVSVVSVLGGVLLFLLVPEGPFLKRVTGFDLRAAFTVFRSADLRAAVFGYWGHMWELYSVYAFVPVMLAVYEVRAGVTLDVSFWAFMVIGAGFVGCALGGVASRWFGSARVAAMQLGASGLCCLVSPLAFALPPSLFLAFFVFWGVVVVGDSPQYSALTAVTAPRHLVGSALTLVTSIGFFLTIPSIQLIGWLIARIPPEFAFLALVPGPVLGMSALSRFRGTPLGTGRTDA